MSLLVLVFNPSWFFFLAVKDSDIVVFLLIHKQSRLRKTHSRYLNKIEYSKKTGDKYSCIDNIKEMFKNESVPTGYYIVSLVDII